MKGNTLSGHKETENTPIRGVIFDMDGLLLDSESLAIDALIQAGRDLGHDVPESFCRRMVGVPADGCRKLVLETYGTDFPTEAFFALQEKHLRDFVNNDRLTLKKGVLPLLDLLDTLGLPRAIATSSSRPRATHHLARVGLADRFHAIITRDDVTNGKPDPEPYLTAARHIGVDPAFCLALEDSPSGARAAQAANIRVIIIPDLITPPQDVCDKALAVVDDLTSIPAYITPQA
ncbi:HAD family phosphatase [Acetobacter vaccinii]|uniref:HAD family phosphatase n=1 Tax=Acetobacter vaccinii TaxID=2592655 RepID=A0A5C1YMZ6_9PROT|nr:HAD family phosphatase [Acetobacter vaccinii]